MAGMDERERSIREKRAAVYDGMSAIMEKFAAGEELSVEDRKTYDDREAELRDLDRDLKMVETHRKINAGREEAAETRGVSRDENDSQEKAYASAFTSFLKRGKDGLTTAESGLLGEHRAVLDANALQTLPNAQGGYTIPQGFWHNLQIALKAYGGLLAHANVQHTATGNPLPWPTINPTGLVGSYITEANQLGFTDFVFGQGLLNAWTITSGVVLASLQLINDSAFDVDSFVTDRIGEMIGRKVAQELQTGSGTNALLGINTALAALGVTTGAQGGIFKSGTLGNAAATAGGNVSTLQNPTAHAKLAAGIMGFDDALGMIAKIDPAYRAAGQCTWIMNDTDMQNLRSVTDTFGHPLWQPGLVAGAPDMILNYPVQLDNNTASVSTTASTVGGPIFGDFKRAMVVRQVDQADVMRLTERYADYLQVGYLGFVRMDSRSNDLRSAVQYSTNAT